MKILIMYITTMAVTFGGIFNMFTVRTKWFKKHKYPIDCYRNFIDNKRIFGDNKTFQGLLSMTGLTIISNVVWGMICNIININRLNQLYIKYDNTIIYNATIGLIWGLTYCLCELPNSFIKRRLDISPGKTVNKGIGSLFFVIDQIDSALGVVAILFIVSNITIIEYIEYIVLWGFTHISINFILYKIKVRKNL